MMTLRSMIPATVLLAAIPWVAGAAVAAPMGAALGDSVMPVQHVNWRGGPRGERLPMGNYGSPAYGYGYDYDYDPGYSTYAYDPGYYDYRDSYSGPGYSRYGYVAPGRDTTYCEQRYRSYDPASGTYMGYDGVRHSCP